MRTMQQLHDIKPIEIHWHNDDIPMEIHWHNDYDQHKLMTIVKGQSSAVIL